MFRAIMLPIKTSGRTKAQIVAEAEATWMLSALLGEATHDENCRCMACFHRVADRILKAQEEALNETRDTSDMAIGDTVFDVASLAR